MPLFTPEELEALRQADAELEATFCQTQAEIQESRERDRLAKLDRMSPKKRKAAAKQRAYYEANKEKKNAYMREYMRRRRAKNEQGTSRLPGHDGDA